jgi:integrase
MKYYINKALQEQEQIMPTHKRWIYQELTEFRTWLYNHSGLAPRTAQTYLIQIREIYSHYDVQLPQLKPIKIRNPAPVTYNDLPSHEEIRKAIGLSDTHMKALIYFQSSSGTTLHESTTITVGMFMDALNIQCKEENIIHELTKLKEDMTIVPTFRLERTKTNKFYYTCCSPEATNAIIGWVLKRHYNGENITCDSYIFPLNKSKYTYKYQLLNQQLGLGLVGHYGKFRSHALRKFHASNLGCGADLIDELQGRGKSQVHEAYIKDKPDRIHEEYLKYMPNILINMAYEEENKEEDTITDGNRHDSIPPDSTGDGHGDMQTAPGALMKELLERVAVLEYRVKQLEQKGV